MEQLETEKKSEKIIEETENTNLQPDTPKRKWGWFIAGGILLISLIAGAVYYNSLQTEATNEDLAYGVLANNDNPQDYKDFLTIDVHIRTFHLHNVQYSYPQYKLLH